MKYSTGEMKELNPQVDIKISGTNFPVSRETVGTEENNYEIIFWKGDGNGKRTFYNAECQKERENIIIKKNRRQVGR